MAKSRRSRKRDGDYEPLDVERIMVGSRRTEVRASGEWTVQPIGEAAALKTYLCPGCSREIPPGTAHIVAWRADGILGPDVDVAARRHWHTHCWKVAR